MIVVHSGDQSKAIISCCRASGAEVRHLTGIHLIKRTGAVSSGVRISKAMEPSTMLCGRRDFEQTSRSHRSKPTDVQCGPYPVSIPSPCHHKTDQKQGIANSYAITSHLDTNNPTPEQRSSRAAASCNHCGTPRCDIANPKL